MATPIGNLGDITIRAVEVLKQVAVIAAEDTRTSRHLLDRYHIAHGAGGARLVAVHAHNERRAAKQLIAHLSRGQSVALVSDAGMPGVSDPGARVVAAVREAGFNVVPIPGPSAVTAALSASGFGGPFLFQGFLPERATARAKLLGELEPVAATLVFYEAPHRVAESIAAMRDVLGGERQAVLARELTKVHETFLTGTLAELAERVAGDAAQQRGEIVLLVQGCADVETRRQRQGERVLESLIDVLPLARAVALAVELTGAKRNALYARALAKRREDA